MDPKFGKERLPVVVAILDTGIDFSIPVLNEIRWQSYQRAHADLPEDALFTPQWRHVDFTKDPPEHRPSEIASSSDLEDAQHGTRVTLTMLEAIHLLDRLHGSSTHFRCMALKVQPCELAKMAAITARAIRHAVDAGAQLINCSFVIHQRSPALLESLDYAKGRGVLVVAAAGNGNQDLDKEPVFPAAFAMDNLVTVAACHSEMADHLSDASNFGCEVDLAAAAALPSRWSHLFAATGKGMTSYATAWATGVAVWGYARMREKGRAASMAAEDLRQWLLNQTRSVVPSIPTGIGERYIKQWGTGNPVLDIQAIRENGIG